MKVIVYKSFRVILMFGDNEKPLIIIKLLEK